ncbi:MAG: sigma-70 family RNA polymerase sigma factor [Planctomycetota bacterium]
MTRREEVKLIRAAAAGDREAAGTLLRTHQRSVYAYVFRLCGRPHLSEDIVQDAFVRVLTNLHRFDERYRFSTWLFTIARRLLVNALAKFAPSYDSDRIGARGDDTDRPDPVAQEEWGEVARDALTTAMLKLSTVQREVLVLFHQHDWPIALIADHTGLPSGTVKSHLHRGRNRLRELMADAEQADAVLEGLAR